MPIPGSGTPYYKVSKGVPATGVWPRGGEPSLRQSLLIDLEPEMVTGRKDLQIQRERLSGATSKDPESKAHRKMRQSDLQERTNLERGDRRIPPARVGDSGQKVTGNGSGQKLQRTVNFGGQVKQFILEKPGITGNVSLRRKSRGVTHKNNAVENSNRHPSRMMGNSGLIGDYERSTEMIDPLEKSGSNIGVYDSDQVLAAAPANEIEFFQRPIGQNLADGVTLKTLLHTNMRESCAL